VISPVERKIKSLREGDRWYGGKKVEITKVKMTPDPEDATRDIVVIEGRKIIGFKIKSDGQCKNLGIGWFNKEVIAQKHMSSRLERM